MMKILIVLLMTFASLPVTAQTAPWHVGNFTGRLAEWAETALISLICRSAQVCELVLTEPGKAELGRMRTEKIEAVDRGIPNTNLQHAREAVRASPGLYRDEKQGAMLAQIRAVLESDTPFSDCVGDAEEKWYARVCRFEASQRDLPDAILLLSSMYPTCERAVCAYFFVPLKRVASSKEAR